MDANVSRRVITFPCEGAMLFGTLDEAPGRTGLLIASGGNEIRIGAHRGMAWLAAQVAAAGHPVLRYDRRGIGDSEGENGGFESAGPDLAAALAAFREQGVERVIGFGNCDAASLLALDGGALDGLVLANPWVIEAADDLPPPAAIRARYAERLRDPAEWRRLLTGGVDMGKLVRGVGRMLPGKSAGGLADRIAAGLRGFNGPITLLLAERDNTAIAFADAWRGKAFDAVRDEVKIERLPSASHSFASAEDQLWLREKVLGALV